jgi:DNA-binding NtrC family response regulator
MSTEAIPSLERSATHAPRNGRDRELQEFLRQVVQAEGEEPLPLRAWLDLAEAWKITRTLRACRGNRSAAARRLGIGRRTLYAKMEKLQITPTWAMGGGQALDG